MLLKNFAPILLASVLMISCSDFLNSKDSPKSPSLPKPTGGNNPFPTGFDPNAGEFSESKMLANIGLNVIAPLTKEFRLQSEILESDVNELCEELNKGQQAKAQEELVQKRWSKVMLTYHALDAVPVGPLDDQGRLLSDNIYGWPSFNACGIDLEVVKLSQSGANNPKMLFTLKGLGAIEYLFFDSNLSTQCNALNPNHKPAFDWAAKPTIEKRKDRCQMARQLMADLVGNAQRLESAWNPAGQNFSKVLVDNSRFPSIKAAVNAMSDALFSVEDVKDLRLGRPLGLHKDCLSADRKCASLTEHRWSNLGLRAISARLRGFRAAFFGSQDVAGKGFGFDDDLKSIGREDVANNIANYLNQALATAESTDGLGGLQAQIEAMNPSECQATSDDNPLVKPCLLHRHVKQLTSKLKTEFLIALSLRAPPTHQGDND